MTAPVVAPPTLLKHLITALRAISDAAWALRTSKRVELRKIVEVKVREHLAAQGKPVAAADAVAVAAAAAAAADPWGKSYSAAYKAARKYYDEHPLPVMDVIKELAASQQDIALELLDKMIDPAA